MTISFTIHTKDVRTNPPTEKEKTVEDVCFAAALGILDQVEVCDFREYSGLTYHIRDKGSSYYRYMRTSSLSSGKKLEYEEMFDITTQMYQELVGPIMDEHVTFTFTDKGEYETIFFPPTVPFPLVVAVCCIFRVMENHRTLPLVYKILRDGGVVPSLAYSVGVCTTLLTSPRSPNAGKLILSSHGMHMFVEGHDLTTIGAMRLHKNLSRPIPLVPDDISMLYTYSGRDAYFLSPSRRSQIPNLRNGGGIDVPGQDLMKTILREFITSSGNYEIPCFTQQQILDCTLAWQSKNIKGVSK